MRTTEIGVRMLDNPFKNLMERISKTTNNQFFHFELFKIEYGDIEFNIQFGKLFILAKKVFLSFQNQL